MTAYNKYKNKKTVIDGIKFASKKEALRYLYLKTLQEKGTITCLICQPKFELQGKFEDELTGIKYRAISYIADFTYIDDDGVHVEDVKPTDKTGNVSRYYKSTPAYAVFRIKQKLFEFKYPDLSIEIV